jgi:protease I
MKKTVIALLVVAIFGFYAEKKGVAGMPTLTGKKVVMIIAFNNYRDEELNEPSGLFKKAGAQVTLASTSLGAAKGSRGGSAKVDMLYKDIDVNKFDAVVFVGGNGSMGYWDDPAAHKLAKDASAAGKPLAAICAAPGTLAKAGVLKGKRATCSPYQEAEEALTNGGADYTRAGVEVDGNIITADGPQSAKAFGEAILKALSK